MIQRASTVGELASRFLSRRRHGTVTRVFERSAYVKTGADFLLLLWGHTRSPMTVNVIGTKDGSGAMSVGEACKLGPLALSFEKLEIRTRGAEVYRTSLLRRRKVTLPDAGGLAKGAAMLKSLYDSSPHGPTLISDPAFRDLANGVLMPFAKETTGWTPAFDDFLPVVGRGGGFTPAGDDFVSGFTATFNFVSRNKGMRQVMIPRQAATSRTIPESGTIMFYSSKGYADEGLERLILNSTSGRANYFDDLMSMASRGHTSGMDMSLGVLLAEASINDSTDGGDSLRTCLRALWSD